MTREEAYEKAGIMLAFADGKEIQFAKYDSPNTEWIDTMYPTFNFEHFYYRIAPERKYRPFANAEECWEEMKKHQPFGWVKGEYCFRMISYIDAKGIGEGFIKTYEEAFNDFTFADGTPFGKLTEEG